MIASASKKSAGIFCVLLAAALLAHFNSLRNDFTRDDFLVVRDNPFVQDWRNLPKLFDRKAYLSDPHDLDDLGTRAIGSGEATYRPIATFSYFMLYAFFGKNPAGYHASGLLLHAVNAFLAYLVLLSLFRDGRAALFAALLFAVHPAHVEAVNTVSCNEDLLVFLFMMLGFLAHFKRRDALSALAFLAACFSKEMALSFPALLVLSDLFSGERKVDARRYLFHAATLLFYLWIRFVVMKSDFFGTGYVLGTLPTMFKSFARYAQWLAWPAGIRPMMPDDTHFISASWAQPDVLFSAAFCAALFLSALLWRKKYPVYSFGVLWFFLALVPIADISRNTVSGHYLYVPSFGFFALAGALFAIRNNLAGIFFGTALLVCSFLSSLSHFTWRNDFSLFEEILENQPESAVAHSAMGSIYSKWGDDGAAAAEYRVALALDPKWAKDWEALAKATARRGFPGQGRKLMEKAEKLVDGGRNI